MNIIIINKQGLLKEITISSKEDKSCLYKKAGFKVKDGFEEIFTFVSDDATYSLYGKINGKKNQINNYKFHQQITIYGSAIIIKNNLEDTLLLSEWLLFMETNVPIIKKENPKIKKTIEITVDTNYLECINELTSELYIDYNEKFNQYQHGLTF